MRQAITDEISGWQRLELKKEKEFIDPRNQRVEKQVKQGKRKLYPDLQQETTRMKKKRYFGGY